MISILQTSKKDKQHRIHYKNSELERRYYKLLKIQAHNIGFMPLHSFPKVQIRNFCLISGKARSVYSKHFRVSRHQIKKLFNYLHFIKGSSW